MSCNFDPWVRKISWRRAWWPIPVFLPGEAHGPGRLQFHRVAQNQIQLKLLSTAHRINLHNHQDTDNFHQDIHWPPAPSSPCHFVVNLILQPWALSTTDPLSVPLVLFRMFYKWNHRANSFHDSSTLCVLAVSSFPLLSSIPLYGCWFIDSSIDGHLACFQFGAIMSKAVINICKQFSLYSLVCYEYSNIHKSRENSVMEPHPYPFLEIQ